MSESNLIQILDKDSQKEFDAFDEVMGILNKNSGAVKFGVTTADDLDNIDVTQILRALNNVDFKLKLHGQNCVESLNKSSKQVMEAFEEIEKDDASKHFESLAAEIE